MTKPLGRGLCGSLNAHVNHEIRQLLRENVTLRQARYSMGRRLLRATVVGRSVAQFLFFYFAFLATTLFGEWAFKHYVPHFLPRCLDLCDHSFLKDLASYLITGQIGILAIVSVAVGVVTLLSERNDGASVNTDIRLYYVESYSYELAISGVALLLVLIIQLFWPFHQILDALGVTSSDDRFKFGLSTLHATWFCVNLLLFLQFITTTLRFVEPNTREVLRERYSANEVIPRDAKTRLLRVLYLTSVPQMFGEGTLTDGPAITFGYGSSSQGHDETEITLVFRFPSRLVDVRLRPLKWALDRWQNRARQQPKRKPQFGQPIWGSLLSVVPDFGSDLQGECELVLRRGHVDLTAFEKWVIRRSFRFARISSRAEDMPTPDNFLEQLIDKLVRQIEQSGATGFRSALDETVRYHRFVLAAQNTKDEEGNSFNLAEVGGLFLRPDANWVHQYRRAFSAATEKIGSDSFFIDRLSNLASRLVPQDGLNFSHRVVDTLLGLGLYEVAALEDWVTKRVAVASSGQSEGVNALAGSDKRAYENALIGFVGGWENLIQTLISSFSIKRRQSSATSDAQWVAFAKAFPVFQTHMHNAAYFLATAVWNDDAMGAERYRDLLLRWLQPFYADLQSTYLFPNTLLVTPDLVSQTWPTVHAAVASQMPFGQEAALPGPVSGTLLWELHSDVVCISGLVALHWYATGQQPSSTAGDAAVLTLRRQKRESDGSDLTQTRPKTVFRLLFDFAVRYALNPRFAEGRYSATIDGLIRLLTGLSAERMISGRIYGGFGIEGFETLRPVLLAAMAANLPAYGDDGVANLLDGLKVDQQFVSDKHVLDFIWTMQQMVQSLDQWQVNGIYVKAAQLFKEELDVPAATARLKDILSTTVVTFETLRENRLRDAPLDENRMSLLRRCMSESALAHGPSLTCFRHYEIRCDSSATIPAVETEFGYFPKGLFTLPEMSIAFFEDVPKIFVEALRTHFSNSVWKDFFELPRRNVVVDLSKGIDRLFHSAAVEALGVGPEPMLLVPWEGIGEEISMSSISAADCVGYTLIREPGIPSGGGTGYLGSVDGIPVFSTQIGQRAILCSSRLARAITYGVVHDDDIADFSLVLGDDLEKCKIRLKFAQRIEWADDDIVEFTFSNTDSK